MASEHVLDGSCAAQTIDESHAFSIPIPGVTCETIDLSDNSDTLDESCVIIEQSDGDVISGTAIVKSAGDSGRPVDLESRGSIYGLPQPAIHPRSSNESSPLIVLDTPEKSHTNVDSTTVETSEPPRKKLFLDRPFEGENVENVKNSDKTERQSSCPLSFNIFSNLLNVTRANSSTPPETPVASTPVASTSVSLASVLSEPSNDSSPAASGSESNVAAVAAATIIAEASTASNSGASDSSLLPASNGTSPGSSRSSSRCSSRTPVLKDIALSCHLPFCEAKCDVETHHLLLRALSTCIGAISSSSSHHGDKEAKSQAAFETFDTAVSTWEAECADGWNRTKAISEMAKMKEYNYPLLHTASVSGCVSLVRWMLSKGFGDFARPICSPLMQCLLNIDCGVRKNAERVKIFRQMMELMPSEVSNPILDSADRPTSLIIVACSRASRDTSDRVFFASSLRNIIAFITERFHVEIQRSVLQVRNSEGNTCVHELSRLDDNLPILRKLHELCQKLGIVESVFKTTNLRGKSALDLAAEAGAIRLVTFLSTIVPPANKVAPPPVRTPGDGLKEKSATPVLAAAAAVEIVTESAVTSSLEKKLEEIEDGDPIEKDKQSKSVSHHSSTDATVGQTPPDLTSNSADFVEHRDKEGAETVMVDIPVVVSDVKQSMEKDDKEGGTQLLRVLFRPLFREEMKTESKLKIVEKHLTEKRKLASDVKSRMEKHGKNIDDIKVKIEETEEDTRKRIENMKVIYEVLLRTQQAIGANDAKLKELNSQLVSERKTVAMHEKVSQELADVTSIMDQLYSTLSNQMTLNACK